jgi:Dolichyl-phosphate-mannose-protein mannosyltransferase
MSKLFEALNSYANLLTFVIFLAALAGFLVLRFLWPSGWRKVRNLVVAKRFWLPVSLLFLIAFVVFLGVSTFYLGYLDHVETNIAAVAAAFSHGTPLYHGLASAERYSLLYGPITYLPFALALRLLGAKLLSLRLAVLFANICLLALLWNCYRKRLDAPRAVLAVAAVVAFMMSGEPYLFQIRGDVLMVLAVTAGLFGVLSSSRWKSWVILALATGACFGVKVTGALYFLPLFVLLYRRYGLRSAAFAGLGAGLVGILPFAFPGISAANYWLWLHEASLHPFRALEFFSNLRTSLTILLPIVLLLWRLHDSDRQKFQAYLREERFVFLALLAGLGMVTILASKFGSGNHHLLPFYPIVGFLCADIYSQIEAAEPLRFAAYARAVCWLWLVSTVATRVPVEALQTERKLVERWSLAGAVTEDLVQLIHDHPAERIEMGYSKTYPLSLYRPTLVFAGNPLTLDAVALDDMQLSGLSIPQGTIDYIESCGTQVWLIPKDEAPFVISNIYDDAKIFPARNLFEDRFREAFLGHYQKTGSSDYYDLWTCRKDSAAR